MRLYLRILRLFGHFAWLPTGLRTRIVRRFCDPESTQAILFDVPFFGYRYKGRLDRFIDWHVYFLGSYEAGELACLRDLYMLRPGGQSFIDVGANVGHHSLFASRFAFQVHSFEPWDVARRELELRVLSNQIVNIVVHPVALGSRDEVREYFAPTGANTGTGSFLVEHAPSRNKPGGELRVVHGDSYFSSHGISHVGLIKLDVEGWERFVLEGLAGTLARDHPIVFMEFSSTTQQYIAGPSQLLSLFPNGYRAARVRIRGSSYDLLPFASSNRDCNVLLLPPDLSFSSA